MQHAKVARFVLPAFVVAMLAGTGAPAAADPPPRPTTATLRVRVSLARALAAARPTVQVDAAGATHDRRVVRLEAADVATFSGLPPGSYDISVNVPGAAMARMTVRLETHEVVTIAATLAAGGAGASTIVLLDRHRVGEGADLSDRLLHDLPASPDLAALIETAVPFVIVDRMDTGGIGTARPALMGSRGASWTTTSIRFGTASLPDPGRFGLMATAPDLSVVDSVAVTSGLAPVEIDTPGVNVALTLRRPSPVPRGTFQGSITSRGMVGVNRLPAAPSIARLESWRDASLVASGPVHPRAGLLASAALTRTRQQERDLALRTTAGSTSLFGRAVAQPTSRDQLRLTAAGRRLSRPFDGRAQLAGRDAQEIARLWQAHATWDRISATGARSSVSFGAQRSAVVPDISAPIGGVVDRVRDGLIPGPPSTVSASQWDLEGVFQPRELRSGTVHHGLRTGVTLRRFHAASEILALPVVAETVGDRPARVRQLVAPGALSSRTRLEAGLYIADRIELSRSFTVEAGARVDFAGGDALGADTGIDWRTVSPRATFRWHAARGAIFGGYGRYAARINPFLLAYGDPGEAWARIHRWTDPNRNGRFDDGEAGVLLAHEGRGQPITSIDPELRAPRTSEWTAGAEWRVGRRSRLRAAIIARDQTSLLGLVNAGVPLSSYRTFLVADQNADWDSADDDRLLEIFDRLPASFGQDQFVLTNAAAPPATYRGLEVSWNFLSPRWQMLFGATAYRTRGPGSTRGFGVLENDPQIVGEWVTSPNAGAEAMGSSFFDRSYVGKWSASYHAPGDVRMAFTARYQDGLPFSRVVIAELSTGPEMIQAYRIGRTRFTYTATLDARIEKGFLVSGRRAAVRLDVFNLTNHRNEVEEDVLTGPTFRQSTAVQPPLTMRFGFRIDF